MENIMKNKNNNWWSFYIYLFFGPILYLTPFGWFVLYLNRKHGFLD